MFYVFCDLIECSLNTKAGPVQQYISDLLDGMENKFIVFCRHKQVVTAVIQQLAKKNVRYICIDGSVGWSARGVCDIFRLLLSILISKTM